MADEVSVIGIGVETSGVVKGYTALDTLAAKGASAEKSLKNLGGTGAASALDATAKSAGSATSELDRMGGAAGSASKQSSGLALSIGSIVGAGAGLSAVTASISAISGALTKLPRDAFNYAKDIEVSAVGMAGIIGSVSTLNGEQVKYNQALGISQDMIRKLNDDALRTAASSKELVTTFQALLAPGLAAGMGLEQIRELTTVGANAVKSMGLGANQLVQELRDLVAGGITASSSTLATALGLKDADIAKAKASSEGLFAFLMDKLKGFEQSSEAFGGTLQGKIDQLKEGALRVAADGMQPLTVAIGDAAKELSGLFVQVDDSKNVQINPQLVSSLQDISGNIVAISGAVKGGLQGLWEYRDAVTLVVGAWAAFKIGGIAGDIAAAGAATLARAEASRFAAIQSAAESAGNEAVTLTSTQKAAAYLNELRANVARTAAQVAATSGTVAATAAERAHALAVTQLESAQIAASRSAGAFSLAMSAMGGTVGLTVTAIAGLYLAYKSVTSGATEAAAAAVKYKRAIDQSSQGKAVDQRDLSAMQEYVDRLKETRDASLLAGDALRTYRDATGELTAGKASTLGMTIANAEADLERAKLATQTATTASASLGQTAVSAEAAWKKTTESAKTATNIQTRYKEELQASQRAYKAFQSETEKSTTLTQPQKDTKLKEAAAAQAEYEKAIAKSRDDGIKNLMASEGKAAAVAAKREQREDNELAKLKARLESAKSLGEQLRAQLESTGSGKPVAQTEGERESAKFIGLANAQRDAKVASLYREKAALAGQRGEQETANKAMEDAISAAKRENDAISTRIQNLTRDAENQEAANTAYGKGTDAIEVMNLARAQEAVAIAMSFGESEQRIALLQAEAEAIGRLNSANAEGRFKQASEGLDKGIAAAREQAALYADELRLTGMTALERAKITAERQAQLTLAKELDKIKKSGFSDSQKADLRVKAQEKFDIERSAAVNKVVQEDFAKTSEQINQSLTDALLRGFESGKDAAKNMRDVIVNMFKTMVLTPALKATLAPISGAISGAIGGGGGGGSAMQTASDLSSLWGTAGQAMFGATAGATTASLIGANAVGMMGGDALGALIAANGGWAGVATGASAAAEAAIATNLALEAGTAVALEAGTLATAAGTAGAATAGAASSITSAIAAIPGWGWALAGLALVAGSGMFDGGETRTGSRLETTAAGTRYAEGPSGGRLNATLEDKLTKSAFDGINNLLKNLGSKEVLGKFVSGLETSDKGRGGVFAGGTLSGGAKFGDVQDATAYKFGQDLKAEDAIKAYTGELTKVTVEALKSATDLPKYAQRVLSGIDLKKMTVDEAAQALQVISEYPSKLLELAGTSRDALVEQFTSGLMDKTVSAQKAGQNVADTLVASIEQAVMSAGAGQIFDIINQGIVTPVIDAMLTGQALSEAISQESIDATIARATAAATALGALFNDATFQGVMAGLKTTIGGALGKAAGEIGYSPKYQIPEAAKKDDSASKAADDLAKRIKDALDGLKTDGLSLQIELLRAQGDEAGASLAELNKATEGWDKGNRELYRQRLAENTALKEQIRAQNSLNDLRKDASNLAIDLTRAQGNEEAALRMERTIAIKGMTDLEVAQYDVNAATRAQIKATTDLKEAMDSLVSTADSVADKFLSGDALGQFRTSRIADQLNAPELGLGVQFSAALLDGLGVEEIQTAVLEFVRSSAAPQAKAAVLSLGGSLIDLKNEAKAASDAVAATRTGADIALLQAQGNAQAALALQRELDIKGMTDAQVAAYDYARAIDSQITALQQAESAANTRAGADIALMQAQGRAQEALAAQRQLDIRTMSAAEIAAYDYAKAIDAQIAVMQQRASLEQSLTQALGNTALLRQRELEALDASNRPLQQRLYDLEDAGAAMDAALSGVQRAIDAEKTTITKQSASRVDAIKKEIDERSKAIDKTKTQITALADIFGSIADAVKTLRGSVNQELGLLQARAYIDMSLSLAKAGAMPDSAKLKDAIAAVTKDTATGYISNAEFEYAQLVQAGKLDELGGLVGAQKSAQELQLQATEDANRLATDQIEAIEKARDLQLDALDAQLKAAQDQVSVMKGVDVSVQSVTAAVTGLGASISAMAAAQSAAAAAQAQSAAAAQAAAQAATARASAQPTGGGGGSAPSQTTITGGGAASVIRGATNVVTSGGGAGGDYGPPAPAQSAPAPTVYNGINGAQYVAGQTVGYLANTGIPYIVSEVAALASDMLATGQTSAVIAAIQGQGFTHSQAEAILGIDLPQFAVGTNRVPRDMIAQIHEGEAIIPKAFNPWANGGGQSSASSAAMEQAIYTLIARVEELEALMRESNGIQIETRDLVDNVTDGGNMMRANILSTV